MLVSILPGRELWEDSKGWASQLVWDKTVSNYMTAIWKTPGTYSCVKAQQALAGQKWISWSTSVSLQKITGWAYKLHGWASSQWAGSDLSLDWSKLSLLQGTIVSCAGAHLSLWNVNGQSLANITTAWGPEGAITCCCVIEGPAWDTSHVIITGSQDGMVRVGVSWAEWGHGLRNVFISICSLFPRF